MEKIKWFNSDVIDDTADDIGLKHWSSVFDIVKVLLMPHKVALSDSSPCLMSKILKLSLKFLGMETQHLAYRRCVGHPCRGNRVGVFWGFYILLCYKGTAVHVNKINS
jgi:hypothetical protein